MLTVVYRDLNEGEIERIREIDRSEIIEESYAFRNDRLVLVPTPETLDHFNPGELNRLIARQYLLIRDGGRIIGAFHGDELAGVATLEKKRRGRQSEYCHLDSLYVSKKHRGTGIGRKLVAMCRQTARGFGATKLYISATPTKRTVEFYFSLAAKLVAEPDPELFAIEPLDIHVEIEV